jgi:hypothetical protein
VLSDEEILQLARWACAIKKHSDKTVDIEWEKDGDSGALFIVQARPETVHSRRAAGVLKTYRLTGKGEQLLTGLNACLAWLLRVEAQASRLTLFGFLCPSTLSHGSLDPLTRGGLGVAFFAPFEKRRDFFPWRPIRVSPLSVSAFLSATGVRVLRNELQWIWLQAALVAVLLTWLRRARACNPPGPSTALLLSAPPRRSVGLAISAIGHAPWRRRDLHGCVPDGDGQQRAAHPA